MEVTFDDRGLGETCESEKALRRRCGVVRAKKIETRLKQLRAAATLADMRFLPGHCHELTGNLAGHLAMDLDQPYRLVFRPAGETEPGPGGGLDWTTVTAVVVTSIEDYH